MAVRDFECPRLNVLTVAQKAALDSNFEPIPMICYPRAIQYTEAELEKAPKKWSYDDSVFATYKMDTQHIIDECFEFDWEMISVPRMEAQQLVRVKRGLKRVYKVM